MAEKETIQPGKYVELTYDLYLLEDGKETLVHQSEESEPECFVFGVTPGLVPALEKDLPGKAVGDEYDVVAEKAFGDVDPEAVVELERDVFLVDGKFDSEIIKVGAAVPMMTADGYRINGVVVDVTPTHVKMDFNHPLAGKDVRFRGRVLTVRDATEDDIKPQGCGCGDGCNCGDDCNCDSESSCNSGCGCK